LIWEQTIVVGDWVRCANGRMRERERGGDERLRGKNSEMRDGEERM
jgi:hypothetical protein